MGEEHNNNQDKGHQKSAFNAAIAQLTRLHFIKIKIIENREKGSNQGWVTNLFCFREELNARMTEKEKEKCDDFEKKLDDIEACAIGRFESDLDIKPIIEYQRYLTGIEDKLGLAHVTKDDEWSDEDDDEDDDEVY